MTIIYKQLIALLPLCTIGVTILLILLNSAWKNNQIINMYITNVGINLSIYLTKYCKHYIPIYISPLITIDLFSIFCTTLILLSNLTISLSSYIWLKKLPKNKRNEFYLLLLISSIGSIILCSSEHFLTLFIGIELISITSFGIIGYDISSNKKKSIEITIHYILLSIVSSAFFLFGTSLLYSYFGELSFLKIKELLNNYTINHPVILTGLGMIITGIGFKLSIVPFHLLTPKIYQNLSSQNIIFLTTSKITIFLTTIRLFLHTSLNKNQTFCTLLMVLSSISIILGTFMALKQNNIKKLFSYSSITNFGYLTIGIITINKSYSLTIEAIGTYIIGYLISNIGIFNCISIISNIYSKEKNIHSLSFYKSLFWKHPYISLTFTISLLSFIGTPITLGFIGKIYIIILSIHNKLYWILPIIIIGNIIQIIYYMYIITIMFLPETETKKYIYTKYNKKNCFRNTIIITLTSIITILLGIHPQPLINILKSI
ncbi:MAG: NADH:quinone oxidoreductase subunit N [Candidatus Westeberhardia cardiocondylae]|nr:NADH:quinone oxidoreductase subunit N [Candidatus Westeberhardia cardiocondylae]